MILCFPGMIRARLRFFWRSEMIYAEVNKVHEHLRQNSFTFEATTKGVAEHILLAIDGTCRNLTTLLGSTEVDHQ